MDVIGALLLLLLTASGDQPPSTQPASRPSTQPADGQRIIDITGKGEVSIRSGEWARHTPTGLLFAPTLLGARRTDVHSYREEVSDVSSTYFDPETGLWVTLYVYPTSDSAEQQFQGAMQQIERKHPKWRQTGALKILRDGRPVIGTGFCARYESDGPEPDFGAEVINELWVFPLVEPGSDGKSYVVKLRATFPLAREDVAAPKVAMFLHEWLGVEPDRPPDANAEDIAPAA